MTQYKLLILQTACQFSGMAWLHYDTTSRKDAAASGQADWSRMNTDLYNFLTPLTSTTPVPATYMYHIILTLWTGSFFVYFLQILESAYRNIPVHREDRYLLGMKCQGNYFIDMALPFGLHSVPFICCRFTRVDPQAKIKLEFPLALDFLVSSDTPGAIAMVPFLATNGLWENGPLLNNLCQ